MKINKSFNMYATKNNQTSFDNDSEKDNTTSLGDIYSTIKNKIKDYDHISSEEKPAEEKKMPDLKSNIADNIKNKEVYEFAKAFIAQLTPKSLNPLTKEAYSVGAAYLINKVLGGYFSE